jgi:hypothetical protein
MKARPADSHGDYVLFRRAGHYNDPEIFLPPALAAQFQSEKDSADAELLALERAERDEAQAQRKKDRIEAAKPEPAPNLEYGDFELHVHEHGVGRHQILVSPDAMQRRLSMLKVGLQSDGDHAKREETAISAALKHGADRCIVRPHSWREDLEELTLELPAFRQAIEIIRNAHVISSLTGHPPSIPPLLLVGPPGVGKSYFCGRLIDVLKSGSKWMSLDQPTAGSSLRGGDKHWSTSSHGSLYELLALGETANPVIILDEIDKAARRHSSGEVDMLGQLYSALEPETARRITDGSLDVELDASLVFYVATANSLKTLGAALLSRFEVIQVGLPSPAERMESATRIVSSCLARIGVLHFIGVSRGAVRVLSDYSPRVIRRAVEKAVGAAVVAGIRMVSDVEIEKVLGIAAQPAATGRAVPAAMH